MNYTKCNTVLNDKNTTKQIASEKKFCSRSCSEKSKEIIQWPDNLPYLVSVSSKLAVAKQLGVSDVAIAKRLKNHHSIL